MKNLFHRKIYHEHTTHPTAGDHNREGKEQRSYYWIWFSKDSEHKGLWGAYYTYEEAERKAVSKLNVPYEIVKLPTRDEQEASRLMRSNYLDDSSDVEKSFNRFSHK